MPKQKSISLVRHVFMAITFWIIFFIILVLGVNFALLRDLDRTRASHDILVAQDQISQLLSSEARTLSSFTALFDQSAMLTRSVRQQDRAALDSYLPALFAEARALYTPLSSIEVTDKAGVLIGYVDTQGNPNSGRRRSPTLQEALFSGKPETGLEYVLSSGQLFLESVYPLRHGNELVGFLKVQATPGEFIPLMAKTLGVDLVLMTRRDVVSDAPSSPGAKGATPEVKRTLVASSLANWKSRLLQEMMLTPQRVINLEDKEYLFYPVALRFENRDVQDAEILIVVDKSLYPNLFTDQLVIFLAIGAGIALILNLLLLRLIRRYVWRPIKGYCTLINNFIRGDFTRVAEAESPENIHEFDRLNQSIEQIGNRLELVVGTMRGSANELNEQYKILKEFGERLTSAIDQVTTAVLAVSDSARENQITVNEVPLRLSEASKVLTDAALDARGTVTSANTVRRQAEALRKVANESAFEE